MQRYIILLLACFISCLLKSQPKHEIRAAWLTTAYGLDWPSCRATNSNGIQKQQEELCKLLDALQAANFNTILFQTRIRGDVIYPSSIEPWYKILSGKEGKSPLYDPLAFAVRECHKRGMELHAWIVAIPLGTDKHVKAQGKQSVVFKQPKLCKRYRSEWYLDPGNPETKHYLMQLVREIVTNYDIDGIHLDYIRYPDHPDKFPDNPAFRKYGKGKSLAEWRRNNITEIVRHLYTTVKTLKPWIKMSSSPLGKFRDTSRYSSMGWNAYHTVYQDAQSWLKEGIQDMLFPMMYFRGNGFFPFVLDWQEKNSGRYVVPGMGIYFLHPSEKDWPLEEIERQINFTRTNGLAGQAYYRTRYLAENIKNLSEELICNYYAYPALPLPLKWEDTVAPAPPQHLSVQETPQGIYLRWTPSVDNDSCIKPHYILYASDTYPVDTESPRNILSQRIEDTEYIYSPSSFSERKLYFAVSAVDRYGNESKAVQSVLPPAHTVLRGDNKNLHFPPSANAAFLTITDITGRCVLHTPYRQTVSVKKLSEGAYRILITTSANQVFRSKEFIITQ